MHPVWNRNNTSMTVPVNEDQVSLMVVVCNHTTLFTDDIHGQIPANSPTADSPSEFKNILDWVPKCQPHKLHQYADADNHGQIHAKTPANSPIADSPLEFTNILDWVPKHQSCKLLQHADALVPSTAGTPAVSSPVPKPCPIYQICQMMALSVSHRQQAQEKEGSFITSHKCMLNDLRIQIPI